ncbi:glycoside hydrolase family 55 protein, partial [Moniliophthora roreri]
KLEIVFALVTTRTIIHTLSTVHCELRSLRIEKKGDCVVINIGDGLRSKQR